MWITRGELYDSLRTLTDLLHTYLAVAVKFLNYKRNRRQWCIVDHQPRVAYMAVLYNYF